MLCLGLACLDKAGFIGEGVVGVRVNNLRFGDVRADSGEASADVSLLGEDSAATRANSCLSSDLLGEAAEGESAAFFESPGI